MFYTKYFSKKLAAKKIIVTLLKILILHENFVTNLLKKIGKKNFFLLFFLKILI